MTTTARTPAHTARANPLLGTWKLQSFTIEYEDTGEKVASFGAHPGGYLSYGPDGRMYAIVVHEDRQPPATAVPTDAEKLALFAGMAAYAGSYTIDGDTVRHHVDISWIEAWTGTTQERQFRIDGNTLYIRSPAVRDSLNGRTGAATLVWRKVP